MDTCGKDGTVEHVVGQVEPRRACGSPRQEAAPAELAHHFLWRIRRALPSPPTSGSSTAPATRTSWSTASTTTRPGTSTALRRDQPLRGPEREDATSASSACSHISARRAARASAGAPGGSDEALEFNAATSPSARAGHDYAAAYQDALARCEHRVRRRGTSIPARSQVVPQLGDPAARCLETLRELDPTVRRREDAGHPRARRAARAQLKRRGQTVICTLAPRGGMLVRSARVEVELDGPVPDERRGLGADLARLAVEHAAGALRGRPCGDRARVLPRMRQWP